jgi:hypothetical protein
MSGMAYDVLDDPRQRSHVHDLVQRLIMRGHPQVRP